MDWEWYERSWGEGVDGEQGGETAIGIQNKVNLIFKKILKSSKINKKKFKKIAVTPNKKYAKVCGAMSCDWSLTAVREVMSFHLHTLLIISNPTEWIEEEICYQRTQLNCLLSRCSLIHQVFSLKMELMLAILLRINMSHVLGFNNYYPVMEKTLEIHFHVCSLFLLNR